MKFRRTAITLSMLCALLGGCATERLHREGLAAIYAGRYEEGLTKLEQAVQADPRNLSYPLDLKARREAVIQRLIAAADRARTAGDLDNADRSFQRVLGLEPGNDRARRGIEGVQADRRHAQLVASAQHDFERGEPDQADAKLRSVLAENPGYTPAAALRARMDRARGPVTVGPRLHTRDSRAVSLQFRDANTKMVFEVLSSQTGINFVFDKDVRSDTKTTIFVRNVPVEQAIELVLGQNQLARQVLSDNMVLIYPNTPVKQKEYQDQVVKTFYLTNAEPKRAMDMLKTMLNAKTLFVDERAGAVVMRDTPEVVRMAERLLASIDVPESEVMMEVEVLEITRTRMQELGITYPQHVTLAATPLAGKSLVLRDLQNQDDSTITVSSISAAVDLQKSVGTTNVLASPRIRARNHEKAKILIGQRVPVITTSTVVAGSTSGSNSNVQYLDVGLTLEVEPTIYLDGDVAIKVNLEVSSIISTVTIGDTQAYQLGTRNATTLLRLKDGETQILAGLINDQDRRTSTHLPGLGDLPLVGRLFGSRKDDIEKTEIVLSITPRIIRTQPRPGSEDTEFWYGTESSNRSAPLAAAPPAGEIVSTSAPRPTSRDVTGGRTPAAAAPAGPPGFRFKGPGEAVLNRDFVVTLDLEAARALGSVRAEIKFDPAVLELMSSEPGDLVAVGAGSDRPTIGALRDGLTLEVSGSRDAPIRGSGTLVALRFKAHAPSAATVVLVSQISATDEAGATTPTSPPAPLTIVVVP